MTYDVLVKERPEQTVLAAHRRASLATIAGVMGEAFGAIMARAAATGARPAGPPFCLYPEPPDGDFEIVVCLPVTPAPPAADESDVTLETIPGGLVASTFHHGPYDAMVPAYEALAEWMAENGRHPAGPPREVYLNEPGAVADSDLLTEIDQPIA